VAFGLSIGEATPRLGRLWYYEGETFSYRLQHIKAPKSGTVITIAVNSGTSNDRRGKLAGAAYETLHEAGEPDSAVVQPETPRTSCLQKPMRALKLHISGDLFKRLAEVRLTS
jgi:hypothetical protein